MTKVPEEQLRGSMRALLSDIRALEQMIDKGRFETGIRRMGAEQEMFLVTESMHPAPVALKVLEQIKDKRLTTELAQFQLEINATPRELTGSCLRDLHDELREVMAQTRTVARSLNTDIVLAGILPTITKADLGIENMTPYERYLALNTASRHMRGGDYQIQLTGLDALDVSHDNVMFEACNCSLQLHYQVDPNEFTSQYNVAQVITAPILASAVSSPLLFGRRLWHETRIALFERAVDFRSTLHQQRGEEPRVSFGDSWVSESVLELFRKQVARHRMVLPVDDTVNSEELVANGETPELLALRLHNGTVWTWNRPCYGTHKGIPHLRIESRALPSGPSLVDEVANAALFYGLMLGFSDQYGNVAERMRFDEAKDNFFAVARRGLDTQLHWFGKSISARSLLLDELIPLASTSLMGAGVDSADVDNYLGILGERVKLGRTGALWMLSSLSKAPGRTSMDVRGRALTARMLAEQQQDRPIHEWGEEGVAVNLKQSYRTVGQFMTTELFTVREEDLIDLAAFLMDWKHVKHVPVEDHEGNLVGVLTYRNLLRLLARGHNADAKPVAVRDIMKRDPLTVTTDTRTVEAMHLMRDHKVGCLPVVKDRKLLGVITETDLIEVSVELLERYLSDS